MDTMKDRGLEVRDAYVELGDAVRSAETGSAAMRRLLSLRLAPTAIVTSGDTLALGAMKAIRDAGLRVPKDVALVSFDDPVLGELLDPPITALARNDSEMGELAASLMLHALDNEAVGLPTEVRSAGRTPSARLVWMHASGMIRVYAIVSTEANAHWHRRAWPYRPDVLPASTLARLARRRL
jgi:DNA-binding LacI/PurR family transcriptional regulator